MLLVRCYASGDETLQGKKASPPNVGQGCRGGTLFFSISREKRFASHPVLRRCPPNLTAKIRGFWADRYLLQANELRYGCPSNREFDRRFYRQQEPAERTGRLTMEIEPAGPPAALWHPKVWARPPARLETVNLPMPEAEEKMVKEAMDRGRPLGGQAWVKRMAAALDLQHTLRLRGRPGGWRKRPENGEESE